MRIRKVIEEIEKYRWTPDPLLTDVSLQRWVFKHPDRPDRITIIGDLDDYLSITAAGAIINNARVDD